MNGYDLHPEVIVDLDEIWEFIAADSIAAADKVNDEILDAIAAPCAISAPGPPAHRPHLTPVTLHPRIRLPDRLCA